MKKIYAVVAMGLLLTACGQQGSEKAETTSIASAKKPSIATAEDVTKLFQEAGLPVSDIKIVTAADDNNQLLGRPGQYTAKLYFYDGRHPKVDGTDENQNTIEVFASAEDAKTRHDYIESVTKGIPMLLQYMILQDNVLVRLDKAMLPDEAKQYEEALSKIG